MEEWEGNSFSLAAALPAQTLNYESIEYVCVCVCVCAVLLHNLGPRPKEGMKKPDTHTEH